MTRLRCAVAALAAAIRQRRPGAMFEFRCLAVLLLAVAALLGFAGLADAVMEGETNGFDRRVISALSSPTNPTQPIGPPWLAPAAHDITGLGGATVLTLITVMIVGYLLLVRRRAAAILTAVSIGGGSLLSTSLKIAFDRPRPELLAHAVDVASPSFPSGHAMLSAVAYLTVGGLLMRTQTRAAAKIYVLASAVLLNVLIGISRVFLGVHWPTDVLAGWCVGATWALLCWAVALWLETRKPGDRREVPRAIGQ